METTQTDIFFIISSVGFVLLWILVGICLVYLFRILKTFSRILNKLEGDIEQISDVTKDMFLDVRDNPVFRFLFGPRRKSRKSLKDN